MKEITVPVCPYVPKGRVEKWLVRVKRSGLNWGEDSKSGYKG